MLNDVNAVDTIISDFEKSLIDTLKGPEKAVIGFLTSVVEEHVSHKDSNYISQKFLEVIERRLFEVPANRKLSHLYLIDSIVKNLKNSVYPKLFTPRIVSCFTHIFSKTDEKVRKKLFELRKSWADYFPNSVLYELDNKVKGIDPAWPRLARLPDHEGGNSSNSKLASVPPDSPDSTTDSGNSRKRPGGAIDTEFVIDTAGDPKMEKKADKAGRRVDIDMRRSWSQYKSIHHDEFTGDVDMRKFSTKNDTNLLTDVSAQQQKMQQVLSDANIKNLQPEKRQQLLECLQRLRDLNVVQPDMIRQIETSLISDNNGSADPRGRAKDIPQNVSSALDQILGFGGMTQQRRPNMPNMMDRRQHPIFRWLVEVPGMPEFPQIGCDPRLLNYQGRFEPTKSIQIDGEHREVLLDRLQPLIILKEQPHAVRFKLPPMAHFSCQVDNGPPTILPTNGFDKIYMGSKRPYLVCIGGPYHELILDGQAFNIQFNGHPVPITVANKTCVVKLTALLPSRNGPPRIIPPQLDICPPIPNNILSWAGQGLFGNPKNMFAPPMNPTQHLKQDKPVSRASTMTTVAPVAVTTSAPADSSSTSSTTSAAPIPQGNVDVFQLFHRLLETGVITKTSPEDAPEPELTSFDEDLLLKRYPQIHTRMYHGYQCAQCAQRFAQGHDSDDFHAHMDFHYRRRVMLRSTPHRARLWFMHWTNLIKGVDDREQLGPVPRAVGAVVAGPGKVTADETRNSVPAFNDPEKNRCGVCFENFEIRWDDDAEDWMLQECMLLDGGVYHPICAEDAGKSTSHTNTSIHEEPAPDLLTDPAGALLSILQGGSLSSLGSILALPVSDLEPQLSPPPAEIKEEAVIKTELVTEPMEQQSSEADPPTPTQDEDELPPTPTCDEAVGE